MLFRSKKRRGREHNKINQRPPSELSNSKEEAALETDLTLAWPEKEKKKKKKKLSGKRKRGCKGIRIKRYYKRTKLTRLFG